MSASQRELMLDLVSTLETRLGSSLLPCSLPPDVQYYRNQNGTAEGSLYIRSGVPSSPVLSFSLSLSLILPLSVTDFFNYLNYSFCPFSTFLPVLYLVANPRFSSKQDLIFSRIFPVLGPNTSLIIHFPSLKMVLLEIFDLND